MQERLFRFLLASSSGSRDSGSNDDKGEVATYKIGKGSNIAYKA